MAATACIMLTPPHQWCSSNTSARRRMASSLYVKQGVALGPTRMPPSTPLWTGPAGLPRCFKWYGDPKYGTKQYANELLSYVGGRYAQTHACCRWPSRVVVSSTTAHRRLHPAYRCLSSPSYGSPNESHRRSPFARRQELLPSRHLDGRFLVGNTPLASPKQLSIALGEDRGQTRREVHPCCLF